MMGVGLKELLILGAIFVLLFGARHIPALFGSLGKSIKSFKKGLKDGEDSDEEGRPVRDVEELDKK